MLVSHTSPSLIDDILLPAYWSPRTTFGTHFQKRITPLPIDGSLPPGTTGRGYCGSSNPSGTFPDCARLKNRRMVQGSSVTPRCPSSAAIAGHVALPFRNRLISFRYGQSWLWNGFGCDVGFMVKASCRHAPGGVMGAAWLLAAGKKRRKDPAPKG